MFPRSLISFVFSTTFSAVVAAIPGMLLIKCADMAVEKLTSMAEKGLPGPLTDMHSVQCMMCIGEGGQRLEGSITPSSHINNDLPFVASLLTPPCSLIAGLIEFTLAALVRFERRYMRAKAVQWPSHVALYLLGPKLLFD